MSQIAGKKCIECDESLLLEKEGRFCSYCQAVVCNVCYEEVNHCPSCSEKIAPKAPPTTRKVDPEPEASVEPPSEPHLTMYGGTITETEYKLAIRHIKFAWIFMILLGIPIFLTVTILTGRNTMIISPLCIAPLYPAALKLFPGAKKFGAALFRKYKLRRSLIIAQHNKSEQNATGKV